MYVCVCARACVHVFVRVCVCACLCVCLCAGTYVGAHTGVCKYTAWSITPLKITLNIQLYQCPPPPPPPPHPRNSSASMCAQGQHSGHRWHLFLLSVTFYFFFSLFSQTFSMSFIVHLTHKKTPTSESIIHAKDLSGGAGKEKKAFFTPTLKAYRAH